MGKLVIEQLRKSFQKRTATGWEECPVLRDVNLTVEENEFVTVIGPSGCGKTTLLRIIGGLIAGDGGRIFLNGKAVSGPGPNRSIVFQAINLLPWRNVIRNVELGLEIQKLPAPQRRESALRYIELVGLKDYAYAFPHELSGGMQQRVGIARALVTEPDLLLMDEPFGSLDAQTAEFLWGELLKIVAQTQRTVVFVTHNIDEAVYLSDRIVVLTGTPAKVGKILSIQLPKPRWAYDVRMDPAFAAYRKRVGEIIRGQGPGFPEGADDH